jgi:N utilization substance protein B
MLEEKTIYWAESLELAEAMIIKTIESGKGSSFRILPLYKDEEDDVKFMRDLVSKTIRDDAYYQELIADKTKNWDADRIALVDIILMKMALCEILNITSIPIKVSINEYIDISKDYSTPNSKAFINGVIDKLVGELREQGKITKTGRGLLE